MTRTDKPVTFRNDQGRVHAGLPDRDGTYCGREKNRRNGYRVSPRPAITVTCSACIDRMTGTTYVGTLPPEVAAKARQGHVGGYSIGERTGTVWPR